MAIKAMNSFRFDSQGWNHTNTGRTTGVGQNSIASIRATLGADASATYGFASLSELITGFCLKCTTNSGGMRFFRTAVSGSVTTEFQFTSAGEIVAYRQNGVTELGRSVPGIFSANVDTYFEIRQLCSVTVGEIEVRVNGDPTPIINLSGINTGSASVNELVFYSAATGGARDHSAWYFLDTTGPAPFNDFLGHIRFAALLPTAEGTTTGWTPLSGTNNALMVDDDGAQDGDTTYNSANNVGDKDTYVFGDMPTPSSLVYAVQPVLHVRKSDAGVRAVSHVVRSNGVDYDGSVDNYLGNSYVAYREPVTEDPDTSAAWTDAAINAMEVGIKVTV